MVVKNKHGIDELREDKWLDGPGSLGIITIQIRMYLC